MASEIIKVAGYLKSFFLLDWTYGYEIGLFCFCFSNAQRVKKELPNAHWFESLVYFMITTFGGSCTVGLVTAGSPGFLKNDILPLMGTLAWFLAVYGPGDFPDHFASMPGVKEVLIFLKELFRGNGCINTVKQANMLFKATKYYPTPITGPIVCGILGSNAGGFFPPSRGLKAIENGVSWNLQCAGIASALYHLLVHDSFVLGALLRGLLCLGATPAPGTVQVLCVLMFVAVAELQSVLGPHFNPFAKVHHVLYKMSGVPKAEEQRARVESKTDYVGESLNRRRRVERVYEGARGLLVALALALGLYTRHPHHEMHVGDSLTPGGYYLSSCTFLHSLRDCEPTVLALRPDGRLALYAAARPPPLLSLGEGGSGGEGEGEGQPPLLLWASPAPKTPPAEGSEYTAALGSDGVLTIRENGTTKVWATPRPAKLGLHYALRLAPRGGAAAARRGPDARGAAWKGSAGGAAAAAAAAFGEGGAEIVSDAGLIWASSASS